MKHGQHPIRRNEYPTAAAYGIKQLKSFLKFQITEIKKQKTQAPTNRRWRERQDKEE